MLGDVREGLGDHEVGGDLGGLGWPFVELHIHGGGHRGAPGERGDRRVQAPVGEDRGVDAPYQVPDLGQGALGLLVGLGHELRRLGMPRDIPAKTSLQLLPGHAERHR